MSRRNSPFLDSPDNFISNALPDKLPHIFERYYRVDDSNLQFMSFGLSLYICAEIIQKHGGTIDADSKLGEDSTFWFTLPLKRGELANPSL